MKKKIKVEKNQFYKIINGVEQINGKWFPIELKRLIFTYLSMYDLTQYELSFKSMKYFIKSVYKEIILREASYIDIKKTIVALRSDFYFCCAFNVLFHQRRCDTVGCFDRVCELGDYKCYKCDHIYCLSCFKDELEQCSNPECKIYSCRKCFKENFKKCSGCDNYICDNCEIFFDSCINCNKNYCPRCYDYIFKFCVGCEKKFCCREFFSCSKCDDDCHYCEKCIGETCWSCQKKFCFEHSNFIKTDGIFCKSCYKE
jgi:hypothetical protein